MRQSTCLAVLAVVLLTLKPGASLIDDATPMVPVGAKLEKLWGDGEFTEGPALGPDACVYFSDIGNRILRYDPEAGKTATFRDPSGRANGLDFDPQGRLVAAEGAKEGGGRRVTLTEKDGAIRVLADRFEGKRFNSPNDLTVDLKGRVYFSDPRYVGDEPRELDHESVYRIDLNGKVTRLSTGAEKPNGVVLSPDMKTLYVADNNPKGKRQLLAFTLDDEGNPSARRVLKDFGDGRGIDGMCVDIRGDVFAAAGDGTASGVYVFSPEGKQLEFIATPETATNCVFGGRDQKTLFITAGKSLYRMALNVEGFAVFRPQAKRAK